MHVIALALAIAAQAPTPPAPTPPAAAPPAAAPPAAAPPAAAAGDKGPAAAPTGGVVADVPPPAPPARPRLLVIDLADKGAGPDITNAINQAVQAQAIESFTLGETVTTQQIKVALDASATQQLLGCESENCMVDVAKVVDAAQALGGSVAKVGDDVVITILSVKVADGSRLAQVQRKVPANRDLFFYAAKQLTSLALTGRAVDPTVPAVVTVEDGEATILVDGKEIAVAQSTTLKLDPGAHEIRVTKDGFADWKTMVTVEEATPLQIAANLTPVRIQLWPAAIATGAVTALAAGTSVTTWIIAQQLYDGGLGGNSDTSYKNQAPITSDQLDSKAQLITLLSGGQRPGDAIGTPGIAVISLGVAVLFGVATAGLVTTDLILAATSGE